MDRPAGQARRAALRSCRRYLGSPKQAQSLPLTQLATFRVEIHWSRRPSIPGPSHAPGLVVAPPGDRGVERPPRHVPRLRGIPSGHVVPACTKTDQRALGAERTHSCSCEFARRAICPYHAMADHLSQLPGGDNQPLFPSAAGAMTTKAGGRTRSGPRRSHGPPHQPAERRTGLHRPQRSATGAVHLASTQVELWRIQLFGRWGSEIFLHYILDAPLAQLDRLAIESSAQVSIQSARNELRALLAQGRPGDRPHEVVALPSAAMAHDCEAAAPPPTTRGHWVRNNDGGKVHRVGFRPLDSHPRSWRTAAAGLSPAPVQTIASSPESRPTTFVGAAFPGPQATPARAPPPDRALRAGGGSQSCGLTVEGLQAGLVAAPGL